MKSLSELVEEWRSESLELLPCRPDESIAIDLCADQLETRLREADDMLKKSCGGFASDYLRLRLLGTTQSSGGSRGSREGEK